MHNASDRMGAPGKQSIAVIIPCYRVSAHIAEVISTIPDIVDHIIVVDDACPEGSGKQAEALGKPNVTVIRHDRNGGVGCAVLTGYRKARELGYSIMVKLDGDGQMDPSYIRELVRPLKEGVADYTKGNRFTNLKELKTMPLVRLLGNSILSFLVKASSGYWNIMDPTNGFTAIHGQTLDTLNLDRVSKDYFFESDMLIKMGIAGLSVQDVPMPARYNNEQSSLKVWKILFQFPPRLLNGLLRRISFKYFIYDFNMASVYMLLGIPLLLFGIAFGGYQWFMSYYTGEPAFLGTIMLAALPIILAVEFLLQAINIDINSISRKK